MADRDELIADLRQRIQEAFEREDSAGLFTAEAHRTAAALTDAVAPAADPEACHVLGHYHWIRQEELPAEQQQSELVAAVRYLAHVHEVAPESVPDPLLVVLEGQADDGMPADEALELGLVVCLAYESGRHLPLLHRAVALFRIAVARPFEEPLNRAMSLSNLGHTLRLTYEVTREAGALDEAVVAAREATAATAHPEHHMFLANLGLALLHLYWRDQVREHLDEALALMRRAVAAVPPGHPQLFMYRNNLALALHSWSDAEQDATAAGEAIGLTRATLAALPAANPARIGQFTILCTALLKQYERTHDADLLSETVSAAREALTVLPQGHPGRTGHARSVCQALHLMYERTADLKHLREAVTAARAAVDALPAYAEERAAHLYNLGMVLRMLADHTSDPVMADEAVTFARASVAAPADARLHGVCLTGLGAALLTYFDHTGRTGQVTEAVEVIRTALAATPADAPERPGRLGNLVYALRLLYESGAGDELLDEAVAAGREALAALPTDHPNRPEVLASVGTMLARAYESSGQEEYAAEAIAAGRAAVDATPAGHPGLPLRLSNLAVALQTVSHRSENRGLLEEGATAVRAAVAALPAGHPARPTVLGNLANLLISLFQHIGNLELLDEAADTAREAVAATPAGRPHRALHLNSLAIILQFVSWCTGESAPLREAIEAGREAVASAPEGHPHRWMYQGNLGAALQMSYLRTGRSEEIAAAIEAGRESVDTLPEGHHHRVLALNGLAGSLLAQALHEPEAPGLAEAVAIAREAVDTTPSGHVNRNRSLTNLHMGLKLLYRQNQDPALLHETLAATREAMSLTPPGHALYGTLLNNHADSLSRLLEVTGNSGPLDEILSLSRTVAQDESTSVRARVVALRTIAALAPRSDCGAQEALAAAEAAVVLLPQIGLGDLDLADRGYLLGETGSLAPVAAAAALDAGRPHRAVELLEQSRGVLTADSAVDTAELRRLESVAPESASAFEELRLRRESLDRPAPAALPSPSPRDARRAAQDEWNRLLDRIRSLDGFSAFLTPPDAARLTAQAAEGPVVYVSAAPTRCDALILTGDPEQPVHVVPLRDLTAVEVGLRIVALGKAIETTDDPDAAPATRRAAQAGILDVLAWLWDTVTEPVLTALGHTAPPAAGEPWPRVWWCPVGILAYLPLHAAGRHEDLADDSPHRAAPRAVLDRVVSSYTATVRGLAHARGRILSTAGTAIVAVPDAPGVSPLDGAVTEAGLLTELVPNAKVFTRPTRASVLDALPDHPVVHFACHAEPHRMDPWQGRLILHDHATDPLTVADIAALRLDGGLAFLSACNTTLTAPRLADEALHLTGAFQLAGYPHVVGTQWPVADRPAHRLVTDFYGRLTTDGTTPPDPTRAAEALHHATRALRARYRLTPALWAAHTHTGA